MQAIVEFMTDSPVRSGNDLLTKFLYFPTVIERQQQSFVRVWVHSVLDRVGDIVFSQF